jgi:hypothetical protein
MRSFSGQAWEGVKSPAKMCVEQYNSTVIIRRKYPSDVPIWFTENLQ